MGAAMQATANQALLQLQQGGALDPSSGANQQYFKYSPLPLLSSTGTGSTGPLGDLDPENLVRLGILKRSPVLENPPGYDQLMALSATAMAQVAALSQLPPVIVDDPAPANPFGASLMRVSVEPSYMWGANDVSMVRDYLGYDGSQIAAHCQLELDGVITAATTGGTQNVMAGRTANVLFSGALSDVRFMPRAVCDPPAQIPQTGMLLTRVGTQYAVQLGAWVSCPAPSPQPDLGSVLWHAGTYSNDTYSSVSNNFSNYTVNGRSLSLSSVGGLPTFTFNGVRYYVDSIGTYQGHQAFTINGRMYYINNNQLYDSTGHPSSDFSNVQQADQSFQNGGTDENGNPINPLTSFQTYHPAQYEFHYMTLDINYHGDGAADCMYGTAFYDGSPTNPVNGDETPPPWADFTHITDSQHHVCFVRDGTPVCP